VKQMASDPLDDNPTSRSAEGWTNRRPEPAAQFIRFNPRSRRNAGHFSTPRQIIDFDPAWGTGSFVKSAYKRVLRYCRARRRGPG